MVSDGEPRKARTRSLLIQQTIEVTAALGYREASVGRILARTQISRSTFYQHFGDKHGCFLAALDLCAERFTSELGKAHPSSPEQLVMQLISASAADPERAQVIFVESLAAGARAMDRRDALIAHCEELLESSAAAAGVHLAIAPRALVGGTVRLLAIRLVREQGLTPELGEELAHWWRTYLGEAPTPLLRTGRREIEPIQVASLSELEPGAAAGKLFGAALERNQHQRIQAAVIALCHELGYEAMTVATITARAGISRKSFYTHYPSKADAVLATIEGTFQAAMTACAAGFFSGAAWPERAWEGGIALLSFIDANPAAARIGFLEGPAICHRVAEVAYERAGAFTLFLEEGFRARSRDETLPPVLPEALMATMFDWAAAKLRAGGEGATLLGELPALLAVILVPFLGREAAMTSIKTMLARQVGG